MKNFYLILSCCALFSLTAHSENFSGDDFNGAWESDGGNQKVQPVGWHALYSNIQGLGVTIRPVSYTHLTLPTSDLV